MSDVANQTVRMKEGRVVSKKQDKTIIVLLERRVKHPKYGKYMGRSTRLQVHDVNNEAQLNDIVQIKEGRPVSKTKNWHLVAIKKRAEG